MKDYQFLNRVNLPVRWPTLSKKLCNIYEIKYTKIKIRS